MKPIAKDKCGSMGMQVTKICFAAVCKLLKIQYKTMHVKVSNNEVAGFINMNYLKMCLCYRAMKFNCKTYGKSYTKLDMSGSATSNFPSSLVMNTFENCVVQQWLKPYAMT